jgi:hypothetical protein
VLRWKSHPITATNLSTHIKWKRLRRRRRKKKKKNKKKMMMMMAMMNEEEVHEI